MSEYDDIKEALTGLGDTWVDVGRKLTELNCRGYREEGAACPVFYYLTDIKAIGRIERVVADQVWIGEYRDLGDPPEATVALPAAVCEFVRAFDAGDWPDLERFDGAP